MDLKKLKVQDLNKKETMPIKFTAFTSLLPGVLPKEKRIASMKCEAFVNTIKKQLRCKDNYLSLNKKRWKYLKEKI